MSDRAVVMLAVDPSHAEYVRGLLRDALKAAWDEGLIEGQPWGAVELLLDGDAELAYDIICEPESGGGTHVVKVDRSGDNWDWTLEHSLRCRRAGLLNCRLTRLVSVAVREGHMEAGEHQVACGPSGVLLWGDDL